jgi:hypothetical protein
MAAVEADGGGASWQKRAKRRGKWVCSGRSLSAMKTYLLCLLPLALAACRDQPAAETHDVFWANTRPDSVVLKKELGTVYLRVPRAYDTLFTWIYPGDCGACGYIRYRFQPKQLRIYPSTSYFETMDKNMPHDSVYQLTVYHQEFLGELKGKYSPATDSTDVIARNPKYIQENRSLVQRLDFDTLEKINGRYFSVVTYSLDSSAKVPPNRLDAETFLSGLPLHFRYELRTRQHDSTARHFQRDALRLLRTVRIRPGR